MPAAAFSQQNRFTQQQPGRCLARPDSCDLNASDTVLCTVGIMDLKRLGSIALAAFKKRSALNDIRANPQDHTKLDMTTSSVLIYLFPFFTGMLVKVCSKRYQTS